MSITLNRGLATEYSFPARRFSLDPLPWMRRFAESERAYQHGSVVTSDDKVQSRPGRIWGTMSYPSRTLFRAALEELRGACYVEDPTLHADDYWPDRYITIKVKAVDGVYYPTLMSGEVEVIFQATDPFWYSDTLESVTKVLTSQPEIFIVTNNGEIETPVIITYTAGGEQLRVKIRNDNDGSKEWDYYGGLELDDILEVDAGEGTVERNGTTRIQKFRGAWWDLQPGSNEIRIGVTGVLGTSTLQIQWRERYL